MKTAKLSKMVDGWYVGDFLPSIHRTPTFEVGVKWHRMGSNWPRHYQKEAIEINYVIKGVIKINGSVFCKGDIFLVEPREIIKPEFVTDVEVVVVKIPSLPHDKVVV